MSSAPLSNSFFESTLAYDRFMGGYSRPLAVEFARTVPLQTGDQVLDIGCGPGPLTSELVGLVGAENVFAIDPSPPFLVYCQQQLPGITARVAQTGSIPFADHQFDAVLSQLVIQFIEDIPAAGREILRVTKPGGWVAACTCDRRSMEKISLLPRAANAAGFHVPDLVAQKFDEEGSVADWLETIGLTNVFESTIEVNSSYQNFDDLWETYLLAVGPMGPWTLAQSDETLQAIRDSMFYLLEEPTGEITLKAEARAAVGRVPV